MGIKMQLEKNKEYIITIDDMGNDGEGIGHMDGMAVFVKDTAPMDVAKIKITKVKKNMAYGRLVTLLEPSPYRIEPVCPHARRCGGCQIMHVGYEKQLQWKQEKVLNCLKRIGGVKDAEKKMEPIIGMDANHGNQSDMPSYLRYRNKAQFPVRKGKDGEIRIGFYAGRTHDVIDTDVCYLQNEINDEIIKKLRAFMNAYQVKPYDEASGKGLVRHILTRVGRKTGEVMLCLVLNGKELKGKYEGKYTNVERQLVEQMKAVAGMTSISININEENTNRILGSRVRTIWGKDSITDYIGNVKYQINPLSFYQVNPVQTEKLYAKALEYANLQGNETVWDLYCGIGTISLFLAQRAKSVYGVEIVPEAIEDAKINAKLNGFDNVEFFVGKAEEVLPREYEKNGIYADVIVVDPPRKGCDPVAIETMLQMQPKRIVYVSCDPATLARDVKLLCEGGYELERFCPTDMFPMSGHCETVVKLFLKKDTSRI